MPYELTSWPLLRYPLLMCQSAPSGHPCELSLKLDSNNTVPGFGVAGAGVSVGTAVAVGVGLGNGVGLGGVVAAGEVPSVGCETTPVGVFWAFGPDVTDGLPIASTITSTRSTVITAPAPPRSRLLRLSGLLGGCGGNDGWLDGTVVMLFQRGEDPVGLAIC